MGVEAVCLHVVTMEERIDWMEEACRRLGGAVGEWEALGVMGVRGSAASAERQWCETAEEEDAWREWALEGGVASVSLGEEGGERSAREAGVAGGVESREVGREAPRLDRPEMNESIALVFLSAFPSALKTPFPFSRVGDVRGELSAATSLES